MKFTKFIKLSTAMLTCVFAMAVTSCDDDEPKDPELKFDPAAVEVAPGDAVSVIVSEGSAPFTVISGDEAIATASVDDNTITITGVEEGTTTITVTDAMSLKGEIAVTVAIPGLVFDKTELSMDIDMEEIVTVTGGESPYTVTVENPEIASASVTDDKISVKGIKAGSTSITVTDNNKKTGTISVTIK